MENYKDKKNDDILEKISDFSLGVKNTASIFHAAQLLLSSKIVKV